ncbi:retrovirus-related pol polyprotein from transposon TNT 1-94, partial [Tanacetum coccineum]
MKIEELLNVTFDETPPASKISPLVNDDLDEEEAIKVTEKKNLKNDIEDETLEIYDVVNIKKFKNHPLGKIIAMQEELNQFIANDVWELLPRPKSSTIIGTKWVFKNKLDKNGVVSRTKARLVAQGYNQQEGIDYDETYALVARTSKDNEDPRWSTSFKPLRTQKTSSALEVLWKTLFVLYLYLIGTLTSKDNEVPSWSTSFKTRRTHKISSALEVHWKTLFVLYLYLIGT